MAIINCQLTFRALCSDRPPADIENVPCAYGHLITSENVLALKQVHPAPYTFFTEDEAAHAVNHRYGIIGPASRTVRIGPSEYRCIVYTLWEYNRRTHRHELSEDFMEDVDVETLEADLGIKSEPKWYPISD